MSDSVLIAEAGRTTGSAESRRIRREDRIPAVVYGQGMEPLSISVNRRDLRIALSGTAGMNTILDLTVNGDVYPAIVKEVQRHPVRRTVAHVDFIQIDLTEEITVSVPVRLEGEAKQVAMNNGLVDQQMMEIQVRTTPRNIPDELVIDINEMTVDTVITVADVDLPSGVTAVTAGGLGEAAFGSEPDAVISYVSSILGSPTEDSDWTTPETFLCAGTVIREVNWGVLSLMFGDESSSASGRPHFMSYTYGLIDLLGGEPQGLVTSEGLTISNTVATLLARTDAQLDEGDEELDIPPSFFYDREPFPVTGLLTGTSDEDVVLVILGGSGCFG